MTFIQMKQNEIWNFWEKKNYWDRFWITDESINYQNHELQKKNLNQTQNFSKLKVFLIWNLTIKTIWIQIWTFKNQEEMRNEIIITEIKFVIIIVKRIMIQQFTSLNTEKFNLINERKFTNQKFDIEKKSTRISTRK